MIRTRLTELACGPGGDEVVTLWASSERRLGRMPLIAGIWPLPKDTVGRQSYNTTVSIFLAGLVSGAWRLATASNRV